MPDNKIANNSFTSEVTAEFTSQSTELAKSLLRTVFKTIKTEAESVITDPEKRKICIDGAKQILTKPDVQKSFEELLHEAYWKDSIDKDSVANPTNLAIRDTLQNAYNDGRMDGYYTMMMGLMETSAPKGLRVVLQEYFRHHVGNHMFEDRRKVYEQYKEMVKQYTEGESSL